MRRNILLAACAGTFLIGVGRGGAQQPIYPAEPPPIPGSGRGPGGAKIYTPTYSPFGGQQQQQPPANGWQNQSQPVQRPSNFPVPAGPVVPASATAPAPMAAPPRPLAIPTNAPPVAPPVQNLPPASQTPTVQIEKRGPEVVNVGQPLTYEIVVRNMGTSPVYNVRVEDEVPNGVRYMGGEPLAEMGSNRLGWLIGTLEPNGERRIRVDLQTPGEGELRSCATVTFSAAACLRTQIVQPKLAVAMRGPEQAIAGEQVPFQIQVSNPGSGPITGLVLRGKLPEGLQHPQGGTVEAEMGQLAPGETRSVTLTTMATAGGKQLVEIVASADGGMESGARSTVNILEASLLVRRVGPTRCYIKSEIPFELELHNPGSAPAANVTVGDTLPAGLDFVSATDGGIYDPISRTITWRLAALPPAVKKSVGYRVKAAAIGEQKDIAVVKADRGIESKVETAFNVEGVAALQLEVVDLEDPIEVGGELTYEVRVLNQGSCPCTNIQIIATVPDGLQARDASGPSAYRLQGPQIVFEPLGKLATRADVVYRMKIRGLQPGDYRFKVQMTCDQLRQPVYKEESSRVYKDGQ